jgi:hypothetical protein
VAIDTPRRAAHLPSLRWQDAAAQPQTYSARSIGLSSNGHQICTSSCIGRAQFAQWLDEIGGSRARRKALI